MSGGAEEAKGLYSDLIMTVTATGAPPAPLCSPSPEVPRAGRYTQPALAATPPHPPSLLIPRTSSFLSSLHPFPFILAFLSSCSRFSLFSIPPHKLLLIHLVSVSRLLPPSLPPAGEGVSGAPGRVWAGKGKGKSAGND